MIELRSFEPGDESAFAALNRRWIEEFFKIEQSDIDQLSDPQANIIAHGGSIVMACDGDRVLGTGALIEAHNAPSDGLTWYQIIKMATDPSAQGKGIGGRVIRRLISTARDLGASGLWLETNDALGPAVKLYEKAGFRKLEKHELWPTPYNRCNLQLVLDLELLS